MPWVKLDDALMDNPKVLAAGGDATLLWLASIMWSSRNLTDGHVPEAIVTRLTDRKNASALAKKLVEVGLWDKATDGYVVHDYLDHQRSREEIEADREKTALRVAKHRSRNRGSNDVTDEVTNGPVTGAADSRVQSTDIATSSQQQLKPFSGEPAAAAGSVKPLRAVAAASESAKPDLIGLAVAVREDQCQDTIRSPARWRSAMRTRISDEFGEQFAAAQAETPSADPEDIVARVLGVERFHVSRAKRGGAYL